MADHSISASQLFRNSASYRIRVFSQLTPDWSDRLQGMQMAKIEEQGFGTVIELSGVLADQAAQMGVLTHLYDCGIALISLESSGIRRKKLYLKGGSNG
jgi:hypothetical protein